VLDFKEGLTLPFAGQKLRFGYMQRTFLSSLSSGYNCNVGHIEDVRLMSAFE
jgi:hypothetical protein